MSGSTKWLWVGCMVALLTLGSSLQARAEGDGGDGGSQAGAIMKAKEKLGLTDAQVAKLQEIGKAGRAEGKPLVEKLGASLKALGEKVKAGAKDDEIKPLMDTVKNDHRALESAKQKYAEQAMAVLTPTQQAKVTLWITMKKLAAAHKIGKAIRHHQKHHDGD